jgi:hypothetical protein
MFFLRAVMLWKTWKMWRGWESNGRGSEQRIRHPLPQRHFHPKESLRERRKEKQTRVLSTDSAKIARRDVKLSKRMSGTT